MKLDIVSCKGVVLFSLLSLIIVDFQLAVEEQVVATPFGLAPFVIISGDVA